jgi:2'-5' RNA ligase
MEIRSFLAFELPLEIKKIISHVSQEMKGTLRNVRWVRTENIHITMVFMGNVPADDIESLGQPVGEVCGKYGTLDIALTGAGFFGSRRNPRVLWIGLKGDIERMSLFRDDLQATLRPYGINKEKRRFSPHLTLGRFRWKSGEEKQLDEILSQYEDLKGPVCSLNELVLFKSDLTPKGALYTRLNAWTLDGDR